MAYFKEVTLELTVILVLCAAALLVIVFCLIWIFRCRKRRSSQPPILPTVSRAEEPSCTNDAFDCVEEHSARKIEERRRARQQALQYSPRADLSLRKIDPEIGKALAVEQLMRDSLVFDSLPRPPKGNVEIVAAKRDYL
ncbi:hypothetical protein GCK72_015686 [Caenorhabditis remanei]|uniref:Uncharacterized protein n=1 Tax=Caenorhabditis remanei TaxID=31234 RepID=E3N901_CAERE|nr:hypothetical protein GCK72_015686 [Caenorhabditis remanei]EFO90062.1 hypothetical protein CRE_21519 [Caenorhabditis remanei]KAF1759225.1 hypothetical protein GCK72_015686 [Caenorhabditis remanei]